VDKGYDLLEQEFEQLESDGPEDNLADAMVGYAFNHPNWQWLYGRLVRIAADGSTTLRALAYTCIGHLARIHPEFCVKEALDFLVAARERDPANVRSD
jgi:hypothetical protein